MKFLFQMTVMVRKTTAKTQNNLLNWKLEVVDLLENKWWYDSLGTLVTVIAKKSIKITNVLLIYNLDVQYL